MQKYVFIPLDIFRKTLQNTGSQGIGNKLEAWLTFLCEDDPEMIVRLVEEWPEFRPMYEEVYNQCRNIQGVMEMFSKELQELDRNTVQYMIDQMYETIERQKQELKEIAEKKQKAEQRVAELEALLAQQEQ